jgi:hypothetical protein
LLVGGNAPPMLPHRLPLLHDRPFGVL